MYLISILGSLDSEQSNTTNQKENKFSLNRCLFGGRNLKTFIRVTEQITWTTFNYFLHILPYLIKD